MDKTDKTDSKAKKAKGKTADQALTTTNTEVLTKEQLEQQLRVAEETIENAINAFWKAADALKNIRDLKWYQKEYATFPEYLAARWGYSESYVSRLVTAGDTRTALLSNEEIKAKETNLPTAYSFYYALSRLSEKKQLETLKELLLQDGQLTVKKLLELLNNPSTEEQTNKQRLSTAISTIKSLADTFDPENFFKHKGNSKSDEALKQDFVNALRRILNKMGVDIKDTKEE